jgi:hypothetical protein
MRYDRIPLSMHSSLLRIVLAFLISAVTAMAQAESAAPPADAGVVVLENELLRIAVSPVGARIVSLQDKVRQREDVKNLPYFGGANIIRYGKAMNLDDNKSRYELKLSRLEDGTLKLTATATVEPSEDKPAAATVTKTYALAPGSSCVKLALEIRNDGREELGLIPWMQNLLLRGKKAQPEEAHVTENGAYLSGQPLPGTRNTPVSRGADRHYFPAASWSSRVVLPLEEPSNTLAVVTRPEDMYKLYDWHRGGEDFATLEVIAQPFFAKPGGSFRWEYSLLTAAPVRNIVYASPELVIGVSPHPTWLAPETKELALDFAGTRELPGVKVHARLVSMEQPEKALKEYDFTLAKVSAREVAHQSLAVDLKDQRACQLRLTFTRDGKPFLPDTSVKSGEVIIPLVVGSHEKTPVVFTKQTQAQGRLRQIEPQVHQAPRVYSGGAFDAFSFPSALHCFRPDTFQSTGDRPLQLRACAGEYESLQLVLAPKGKTETTYDVTASELTGPAGSKVTCEGVREFIYVPTTTPSSYNALYPVGDYPEALLPVKQITLKPGSNHPLFLTWRVAMDAKPGPYRGTVTISNGAVRHDIAVEMEVWNVHIPLRAQWMEFASSLKGNGLPEAKHADGTPYSKKEQLDAIVDMHLRYRLTPCDSGIANTLLKGDFAAFEPEMTKLVAGGATKLYLGNIKVLVKEPASKLAEVESYLKAKGWTDYFYVRPGFDEASSDLVPQIKAVCEEWKKISRIPIMETYYHDERADELYGLLDIWARSFPASGTPGWCQERMKAGDRFWKVNAMPGILEDEPWVSGRKRYIGLWDIHVTGSYNWTVKQWSGVAKWGEDYWCDGGVGNLSAVLMWPHETGILSTIRLEAMRDGLEDNALLWLLREKVESLAGQTPIKPAHAAALAKARALCNGGPLAGKINSLADLQRIRTEAGDALSILNTP